MIYFVIPKKARYIWLLIISYYFYMGWNAKYALLIAASTIMTKEEYSKAVANYAAENGIHFLDYNPIIDEIGISLDTSFMSGGHLNLEGATAATKYMAKYLKFNFELQYYRNGEENSWDRACAEWHRREQNDALAVVDNLETYLDIVSGDGYTVTFSINGDIDEAQQNLLLSKFGIDTASGVESAVINDRIPLALNGRGISYLWREELDGKTTIRICCL